MDTVRRYYLSLRQDALDHATAEQRKCFVSVNGHYCYQHYACEWGCDVVGSEVGENINSIQAHIAFTRGAARQYGKPWLMDFSSWYGPSIFDEDPRRTWGDNSGPTNGHSLSLHLRTYYVSYMAGANIVVAEGGWLNGFRSRTPGPDGALPLSALGQEMASFYRFTRRHPDRGAPYAPIALLLPFDHGIYPGFGPKATWNAFPYTSGDQQILDTLNALFPGSLGDPAQPERPDHQPDDPSWTDPDYMHTEALRLVASPYGDITDVLLANARPETLRGYPAILVAGDHLPDAGLARRLEDYVNQGGTLLGESDGLRKILPSRLAARLHSSPDLNRQDAKTPRNALRGFTRIRHGRGAIVVLASSPAVGPTADRPMSRAIEEAARELIPFRISGRLETLYNRTKDGWIVTLVNNLGVTKTFFAPPRIDPTASQVVTVAYCGRGRVRRAVLWGPDADEELKPTRIKVTVPPGSVRVLKVSLTGAE